MTDTLRALIMQAAARAGATPAEFCSTRYRRYGAARNDLARKLRQAGLGATQIARALGYSDAGTVRKIVAQK